MKRWLQDFLGISTLSTQMLLQQEDIKMWLSSLSNDLHNLSVASGVRDRALGRIIAKLEPTFGIPEDDPQRRRESDELGEKIITKLKGEYLASKRYG